MAPQTFQPALNARFVAKALGMTPNEALRQEPFTFVTTDSRKVAPGCLFVAIPGEKFDGHEFIPMALQAGAQGVICRRDYALPADLSGAKPQTFRADDTIEAYRKLGAAWRREFAIPVVMVAGSVGKTTTKELLTAILQGKWPKVLKTQGSQNGYVGIPMTLLELRSDHGAAVIEVGIDEIGAMEKHVEVVHANASILTAIGPEHLEKLIDVPTVAREEGIALSHVAATGGTTAIHLDDPWIRPFASTLKTGRKIYYSLKGATIPANLPSSEASQVIQGTLSEDQRRMTFRGMGLSDLSVTLPLLGLHNASNLLGAVAIAHGLGLGTEEIRKGLQSFRGADGRSELKELPGDTPVVCDYYNANPASVEAGLELLSQVAGRKPRWACIGDMLELGANEEKFHRGLAERILLLGVENVLLYGPRTKWLLEELGSRGFAGRLEHFEAHAGMAKRLLENVKPGNAVLIKGSRGMKMEEVWKIFSAAFKG